MADILWTEDEAAKVTDATPFGARDWVCTGISIDSRNINKGDLFIAIQGPSFDGHQFVASAMRAGAAAALVSYIPQGCRSDDNMLLVDDTIEALEDLARASRLRSNAKIVAVTGSVGKTGVKEALATVLSKQGKTHSTIGNLNNHFGLPLTLARMPRDCDYAVLELGMNHAGELTPLSQMAKPHVGVITTVTAAHLENFDGIEGIADAKAEIFKGLLPGGTAVLNADNAYYERMAKQVTNARTLTFGVDQPADYKSLKDEDAPCCGTFVRADFKSHIVDYTVSHTGKHWVSNSLAVLACVDGVGGDVMKAAADMAHLQPLKGRGAAHTVDIAGGTIRVIDESYNANETSMRAALDVLSNQKGRRIAVIGDMLELGPDEIQIHAGLADAFDKVDLVFTCGSLMKHLHDALPKDKRGAHASTADHLAPLVVQSIQPGDVISIKSSRGTRTDLVLDALLDMQPTGT